VDFTKLTWEELCNFDGSTLTPGELLQERLRQMQNYGDRCLEEYEQSLATSQCAGTVLQSEGKANYRGSPFPSRDASGEPSVRPSNEPKTSLAR
jgi:hypothetical protein